jgi:hypothetical protein
VSKFTNWIFATEVLQVDNTNKFSHQFFKVAFEMLQMSQGHFARLFFGDVLGVE